jgi:hypothetical protein
MASIREKHAANRHFRLSSEAILYLSTTKGRKDQGIKMVDYTKIAQEGVRQAADHEKNVNRRIVGIINAADRRLSIDPHDPVVKAIEQLLGVIQGGQTAALETLGIDTTANSTTVRGTELGAAGTTGNGLNIIGNRIVVLDDMEQPAGGYLTVEDARNDGYTFVVYNPDGSVKGLKRPLAPTAPPPPTTVTHMVKVVDKKGKQTDEIELPKYTAAAAKYIVVESNAAGVPLKVREVHIIGR